MRQNSAVVFRHICPGGSGAGVLEISCKGYDG